MTEPIRESVTLQKDGRLTIPDSIRQAVNLQGKKAFVQVEVYGKDKILLTILTRFEPSKRSPQSQVKGIESKDVMHGRIPSKGN